jgi:hypothetical protein
MYELFLFDTFKRAVQYQDHPLLENLFDYFKKLGARIISSSKAKIDQQIRADEQTTRLKILIGDSLKGTEPV